MSKLGIKTLDRFLKHELKVEILERFWDFQIFSEADLQSIVWKLLADFIVQNAPNPEEFKVLNKPYLRGVGIHPDIVIFRNQKPWVIIELKERKELSEFSARKELIRLLRIRAKLNAQKGYLIYVARYGDGRVLRGPKGPAAQFFSEVPIVLSTVKTPESIKKWGKDFKYWSKYESGV